MRIVTNEKLVRRNTRFAQYLFFFSFGVLIVGIFLINQPLLTGSAPTSDNDVRLSLLMTWLVLPVGMIATLISVRMTNLWIRRPRPETAIAEGLKGLSNKSVLYNYHHFPARHVLICPQGIFAIVTRFQDGRFSVDGARWRSHRGPLGRIFSIFRLDSIGDPAYDAQRAARHVEKLLESTAPHVEVKPLIVFVDPRVKLQIKDPAVPVLHADDRLEPNLKDYMRALAREDDEPEPPPKGKKGRGQPARKKKEGALPLTAEQIEAFESATVR